VINEQPISVGSDSIVTIRIVFLYNMICTLGRHKQRVTKLFPHSSWFL